MIRITIDKSAASREELSAFTAETVVQAGFDRLATMEGVDLKSVEPVEEEAYAMLRAIYPEDQITPEMVRAVLPRDYRL